MRIGLIDQFRIPSCFRFNWLTHSYSFPWPLVRHRLRTSLLHFSLSWIVFRSCAQVLFTVLISGSRPLLQVFLGLPLFLLPCGFHLSAWYWMHLPRPRMSPIHHHLLCLISSSIGFCLVAHQRSSFVRDLTDCRLVLYSLSLVLLLNIQKYLQERARSHTSTNTHSCK